MRLNSPPPPLCMHAYISSSFIAHLPQDSFLHTFMHWFSVSALCLALVGVVLGAGTTTSSKPQSSASSAGRPLHTSGGRASTRLSTASIQTASRTSTVSPTQSTTAVRVSATARPVALNDSVAVRTNIDLAQKKGAFFTFNATRDTPITLSLSLCIGPDIPPYNTSNKTLMDELDMKPQEARKATLVGLYLSDEASEPEPGPNSDLPDSHVAHAQGGWASIHLKDGAKNGIWIGVWPPADIRGVTGLFTVQVIASTKANMEQVSRVPGISLDDTDSSRALLTSFNYTQAPNISLMVLPNEGPYSLSSITYYNSSFCAIFDLWKSFDEEMHGVNINSSETTRHTASALTRASEIRKYLESDNKSNMTGPSASGTAGVPGPLDARSFAEVDSAFEKRGGGGSDDSSQKQKRMQFEVSGLQREKNYTAYLVSTSRVNGVLQRTLYPAIKFTTKRTNVCRLLYNVPFCPELAYAIPFNEDMSMSHALSQINSMISANFANFSATLSTFPCDSPKFGMYSSVATCTDCLRAYQNWLCAVAVPRCTDTVDPKKSAASQDGKDLVGLPMGTNTHLYPYVVNRIAPNSSRQAYIGRLFNPGPYGELLPCLTVCEMVVRSCPPLIKWTCPIWTVTAQRDYGTFADADSDGLGYGANGGAGKDGLRFGGFPDRYVATDAFGNTFCNAMDTDRMLRQESGARALRPQGSVLLAAAAALFAVYCTYS